LIPGNNYYQHEWAILQELRNFWQSFAGVTDLVNSHSDTHFLVRAEIIDACKANVHHHHWKSVDNDDDDPVPPV